MEWSNLYKWQLQHLYIIIHSEFSLYLSCSNLYIVSDIVNEHSLLVYFYEVALTAWRTGTLLPLYIENLFVKDLFKINFPQNHFHPHIIWNLQLLPTFNHLFS